MAARSKKTELTEDWKEKIQVSMLMNRLKKHIDGEIQLESTQLKAIELILQRSIPTLSAVEQTTINPDDALTESDLEARIQALFLAHPELVNRVMAAVAKAKSGISVVPTAAQHTGNNDVSEVKTSVSG